MFFICCMGVFFSVCILMNFSLGNYVFDSFFLFFSNLCLVGWMLDHLDWYSDFINSPIWFLVQLSGRLKKSYRIMVKDLSSEARRPIWIPPLPISSVAFSMLFTLSVFHLYNRVKIGLILVPNSKDMGINELIHPKCLDNILVHNLSINCYYHFDIITSS